MYAIKEVAVLDFLLRASRFPGFTALFLWSVGCKTVCGSSSPIVGPFNKGPFYKGAVLFWGPTRGP